MAQINISSVQEPAGLYRSDGKKPNGLTICPWLRSKCLIWNVAVCDPFAPFHIQDSAVIGRVAVFVAEQNKMLKYQDLSVNHLF